MFCALASACAARSRASCAWAWSPVSAARMAVTAASRKAAGSLPPLASRTEVSIAAIGSATRDRAGAAAPAGAADRVVDAAEHAADGRAEQVEDHQRGE